MLYRSLTELFSHFISNRAMPQAIADLVGSCSKQMCGNGGGHDEKHNPGDGANSASRYHWQ